MNKRIRTLRKQSLDAVPHITPERARLVTEFYNSRRARQVSMPIRRALTFQHILENKDICVNAGELIVGERGPAPKATPTYPEITAHSLEDLDTLHSRKKTSYKVDDDTRRLYQEKIIPFWKGQTLRDKLFAQMSQEWKAAFDAGVFTEFMEQRAPGHTVLGDKIYRKGMLDISDDIDASIHRLDFVNDPAAYQKREELRAMRITAEALITYAHRHAEKAAELAEGETDPVRREELFRIAENCRRVPAHTPRDFWEALQYYWFVHLGVIIESNPWDSFNPGRLDQHLIPFYKNGLSDGTLSRDQAKELLQAFWIKFNNQPAPTKVGVTAEESGTYTDFALINTGGVTADGSDAVNELTYLILDVVEEMRLLQPSSCVQLSKKNPDSFLVRALRIIKTGFGQPSIFNTDAIVQELVRQGKSLEDARCGGASGCVEVGAFGKESYILTGYFNLVKVLEITLNNGVDPGTGNTIGIETGPAESFQTVECLMQAFKKQLRHFIDIKIKGNNIIERLYAEYLPVPFLSILIDDCIANGKEYNDGGARYNTSYIQGVGIGTITDSLAAIKYHVYDEKTYSMKELMKMLRDNFKENEPERQCLINKTPKYGNDDDAADDLMKQVFDMYYNAVDGRPNTKGGHFRINLLPTTVHIYFGRVVGATPDGRKKSVPLSEGISPVQGADRNGPTSVIKSVGKMDHIRTGGTLLNMKFMPQVMSTEEDIKKLAHLVRSHFKMDSHHVQFNVVSAETLRQAQKHPEQYRDLVVRVAGYSDYFVDLGSELQNEIIRRTAHTGF